MLSSVLSSAPFHIATTFSVTVYVVVLAVKVAEKVASPISDNVKVRVGLRASVVLSGVNSAPVVIAVKSVSAPVFLVQPVLDVASKS